MKVVLLHDDVPHAARPDELDVLVQADTVAAALAELGHRAERLAFSLDLRYVGARLEDLAPDVVFNLVEEVWGEGRLCFMAPALLERLKFRFTGSGAEALFTTTGKTLTKRLLRAAGMPTPDWLDPTERAAAPVPGEGRTGTFDGGPVRYIVKPLWEEASVGLDDESVVSVSDEVALRREIDSRARRMGRPAFAERYIEGREFNLSVLAGPEGPRVLPPAEILFVDYPPDRPRVVGYPAKWAPESFEYNHTPRSFDFPAEDARLLQTLCDLTLACWDRFGLRGYARVDFRVDASGQPWILELNANPCIAPDAGFPAAVARAGLRYTEMVERILADAVRGDGGRNRGGEETNPRI